MDGKRKENKILENRKRIDHLREIGPEERIILNLMFL
jgi:hypothetical protein